MQKLPELYMLNSCPFCWKVRGMLDILGIEHEKVAVNPMKAKKTLPSAPEWTKTPVWRETDGEIIVDSTPIMQFIDEKYNDGALWKASDEARRDHWLEWLDSKMSKATIPILYGSLFSALRTTRRVAKMEKFGFFSRQIYAWAGFPIMWGFIARKRVKNDGRKPKQLWHDLLDEFLSAFTDGNFFGGESPDMIDLVAFGYVSSIEPYPQFSQVADHKAGMIWFKAMKEASKA